MRVFILNKEGNPLTPTTSCRARKLLKSGVAKKVWSKFNTFGIQMLVEVGNSIPIGSLGIDLGTKFEGYSVVVGTENLLNIKLNLPKKQTIVKKLKERSQARRTRRSRLRRRECRFNNRSRKNFIAPSQNVLVLTRINMIKNICKIYPIKIVGLEDICFNHRDNHWGKNFSTMEIGKNKIREYIKSIGELKEFKGHETKGIREKLGYKKCSDKRKDVFESHCSDSLSLAIEVNNKEYILPSNLLITVDKTYLPVRRKIHDSNYSKGGIKKDYSKGTILTLQKGGKVGYKGMEYRLTGINKGRYTITDIINKSKRNYVKNLDYCSNQYICKYSSLLC